MGGETSAPEAPRVSVVIPTYNRSRYLSEAIESVLAQAHQGFELIVVDDGSTDGTPDVVSGVNDSRLRYVRQENLGGSAARNRGWRESSGPYLLFLDDDDRLLAGGLEALLERAADCPDAGVIGGDYEYIDGGGQVLGRAELWKVNASLDLATWVVFCAFIPSATLVRADWLERVGGFDVGQDAAQDWDLWLRLAGAGCPMKWLEVPVSQYRLHGDGVSRDVQRQLGASARALGKVFSRQGLPAELVSRRGKAYAVIHLYAAARWYAEKEIRQAQEALLVAASDMPRWVDSGILLERLLRLGASPILTGDSDVYTETVLGNLPPGLFSDRSRRRALARLAAAQLFSDYRERRWTQIGSLWRRAAWYDPTWLTNKGFVVIGLRSMLRMRS